MCMLDVALAVASLQPSYPHLGGDPDGTVGVEAECCVLTVPVYEAVGLVAGQQCVHLLHNLVPLRVNEILLDPENTHGGTGGGSLHVVTERYPHERRRGLPNAHKSVFPSLLQGPQGGVAVLANHGHPPVLRYRYPSLHPLDVVVHDEVVVRGEELEVRQVLKELVEGAEDLTHRVQTHADVVAALQVGEVRDALHYGRTVDVDYGGGG